MAKAKKRRNSHKKAQKRAQKRQPPKGVVDPPIPADETTQAVEGDIFDEEALVVDTGRFWSLPRLVGVLAMGVVLVIAGIIIWRTLASPPTPSQTPRPTGVIPLEGTADPNQLQSGGAGVQNGGNVGEPDNSASGQLQPQESLTPQEQENLLR